MWSLAGQELPGVTFDTVFTRHLILLLLLRFLSRAECRKHRVGYSSMRRGALGQGQGEMSGNQGVRVGLSERQVFPRVRCSHSGGRSLWAAGLLRTEARGRRKQAGRVEVGGVEGLLAVHWEGLECRDKGMEVGSLWGAGRGGEGEGERGGRWEIGSQRRGWERQGEGEEGQEGALTCAHPSPWAAVSPGSLLPGGLPTWGPAPPALLAGRGLISPFCFVLLPGRKWFQMLWVGRSLALLALPGFLMIPGDRAGISSQPWRRAGLLTNTLYPRKPESRLEPPQPSGSKSHLQRGVLARQFHWALLGTYCVSGTVTGIRGDRPSPAYGGLGE